MKAGEVRSFVLAELDGPLREAGLDPATAGDELDLIASGVVDSLGMMELIMAVNDRFQMEVDFEGLDPEQITVLGSFASYVEAAA